MGQIDSVPKSVVVELCTLIETLGCLASLSDSIRIEDNLNVFSKLSVVDRSRR